MDLIENEIRRLELTRCEFKQKIEELQDIIAGINTEIQCLLDAGFALNPDLKVDQWPKA